MQSDMVVLEVFEDGLAAVLDKKGTVQMIPDKNYRTGQVLHIDPESIRLPKKSTFEAFRKKLIPLAACFAAAVVGVFGGTSYAKPISKLSVNSGASMEYELNVFDRVIKVKAQDEKAEEIKDEVYKEVHGKTVKQAVPATLDLLLGYDYIPAEGTENIFTVSASGKKAETLTNQVQESVNEWTGTEDGGSINLNADSEDAAASEDAEMEEVNSTLSEGDAPAVVITDGGKPKDLKTETDSKDNKDKDLNKEDKDNKDNKENKDIKEGENGDANENPGVKDGEDINEKPDEKEPSDNKNLENKITELSDQTAPHDLPKETKEDTSIEDIEDFEEEPGSDENSPSVQQSEHSLLSGTTGDSAAPVVYDMTPSF